jgi:hypothetical protein
MKNERATDHAPKSIMALKRKFKECCLLLKKGEKVDLSGEKSIDKNKDNERSK